MYKYEVEAATRAKNRLEYFAASPSRIYAELGLKARDEKTVSDFETKYGKL